MLLGVVTLLLGFGIFHILNGLAKIIENRDRIKVSWLLCVWSFLVFLFHVKYWFVIFSWVKAEENLLNFLSAIMPLIFLYLATYILMPIVSGKEESDYLNKYYFEKKKNFFAIAICGMVFLVVANLMNTNDPLLSLVNLLNYAAVVILIFLWWSKHEIIHWIGTSFLILIFIIHSLEIAGT